MGRQRPGRNGILFGLLWTVLAWVIFFASYTGFGAGLGSLPLSAGYLFVQRIIAPISATLATYLNAFICSVPFGAFIGWAFASMGSALIKSWRRRVVFYRAKAYGRPKRRYMMARRKGD